MPNDDIFSTLERLAQMEERIEKVLDDTFQPAAKALWDLIGPQAAANRLCPDCVMGRLLAKMIAINFVNSHENLPTDFRFDSLQREINDAVELAWTTKNEPDSDPFGPTVGSA